MEDVLTTIFAIIMLAVFCAMFGYELRVLQEERALARRIKRVRKVEGTPHPSPAVTPFSICGEGYSVGVQICSAPREEILRYAQNDSGGAQNDSGGAQNDSGGAQNDSGGAQDDRRRVQSDRSGAREDRAMASTDCIIAKYTDFPEDTECRCYSEGNGTMICSRRKGDVVIQKRYKDGKLIATKEVYGCRKKEADAGDR